MDKYSEVIQRLEFEFLKVQIQEVEHQQMIYAELASLLMRLKELAKDRLQNNLTQQEIEFLNQDFQFLVAQYRFVQTFLPADSIKH